MPAQWVFFTRPDGAPFHPGYFSQRFRLLIDRADLPPIRLQDLRHGTASLAHSAGADLKTIQGLLGHSTIAMTADVYTNVLPAVQRTEAEATARLILGVGDDRLAGRPVTKRVIQRPRRPHAGQRPNAAEVPAAKRRRVARNARAARRRAGGTF
ncbi:tyrosine-type recombinase/integrase [Dactylosporangium roseum]|uniref:tyrosine-type recombinase/integrase n=1 Tax=Dactylosporangium roseum TaxID=47989 RepID=UPI0021B4A549|nr:tyrosine-type recombinase/integrase [Dactylosporangium roseum]